jgi:Zn-dependent protease with chaperone function
MYGSILNFLIAIAIQALAPREPGATWSVAEVAHVLVYFAAAWVYIRFRFRRLMAGALHDDSAAQALRVRFAGLVEAYQGGLLLPFALVVYTTHYPGLVIQPAAGLSEALASALGVVPYVALLLILWWEAYPLQGVLLGRSGTRGRFVLSHARMEFPVLVPWLALMSFSDLFGWIWPSGYSLLDADPVLQLLYAPVFLVLVGVFLPVLVKAMWGCEPVPVGPLRQHVESLCSVLGLKVRQILYWPLLEGRVLTAGVVGLVPRFRYLLLTPALVEVLLPAEMDGVVAHEAGHVRYRHLWFYLFFFVGYISLVAIFFRLAEAAIAWWGIADPQALRNPRTSIYTSAGMTSGMLVILLVYFRFLFGAVSRGFERQADVYALEVIGRPDPLISALERISYFSGDIRDLPSWHHGSIGERVAFLTAAARDPEQRRSHHRRVKRRTAAIGLGVIAASVLAWEVHSGPLNRNINLFVVEQGLLHRVKRDPKDAFSWFRLGVLYYEMGDEAKAESAYEEAILFDPDNAEAMNNLAWLYVTTKDKERYRPERAVALARMAAKLNPEPHILDTLAEALYRVHDIPGALAAIDAALARNPDNRAYYLAQQKKFQEALEKR